MAYKIVEFVDDQTVQCIPSIWLKGEKAFWFPNGSRNEKYIMKNQLPADPKWPLHSVRILCSADNYEQALQLEKEFVDSSGINASQPLGKGLRKKRKPARIAEDFVYFPSTSNEAGTSNSSSDDELDCPRKRMKSPPQMPSRIYPSSGVNSALPKFPHNGPSQNVSSNASPERTSSPMRGESSFLTARQKVEFVVDSNGTGCESPPPSGHKSEKWDLPLPTTVEELSAILMAREAVWKQRYERLEGKINTLMSMLDQLRLLLCNKLPPSQEEPPSVLEFPICSMEEMEEMENKLSNDTSLYRKLVDELVRRCSEDGTSTYKMMYFLLKDAVAKEYCLTGKVGCDATTKRKFMDTKLYRAILDAYGMKPGLRSVGVEKINKKIGEWLRQTGTRMRRSQGRNEDREFVPQIQAQHRA